MQDISRTDILPLFKTISPILKWCTCQFGIESLVPCMSALRSGLNLIYLWSNYSFHHNYSAIRDSFISVGSTPSRYLVAYLFSSVDSFTFRFMKHFDDLACCWPFRPVKFHTQKTNLNASSYFLAINLQAL